MPKMKLSSVHVTTYGRWQYWLSDYADPCGFVTYHASRRYWDADDDQLDIWSESRLHAVRAAVAVERASRAIDEWNRR